MLLLLPVLAVPGTMIYRTCTAIREAKTEVAQAKTLSP